ncbi:MAG: hypothetical protein QXL89_01030 [Nitrososphaeria archaeon]
MATEAKVKSAVNIVNLDDSFAKKEEIITIRLVTDPSVKPATISNTGSLFNSRLLQSSLIFKPTEVNSIYSPFLVISPSF